MSSEYTREFVMKFLPAQFLKCTYQCKPRGGVRARQILKFFDQIPQGGKRKVNQKRQNSQGKKSKQTIL